MADFDDEAVDMSAPKPARRRQADWDDEDEAPPAEGEQPVPQARPPMKGWGDSAPAAPSEPTVTRAVAVESGSVTENFDEASPAEANGSDGAPAIPPKPSVGFGRRSSQARGGDAPRDKYDNDQITDITEIPDLEDDSREADLTTVVAEAPNVRSSNRVQALKELDQQIMGQLLSAMADGIDLSLLTAALSPQESVAEPDQLWEFEQLFADVSSEMQAEMEPEEKEEGEEDDDENAGVARGDGKKAAPLRDRSAQPVGAK